MRGSRLIYIVILVAEDKESMNLGTESDLRVKDLQKVADTPWTTTSSNLKL